MQHALSFIKDVDPDEPLRSEGRDETKKITAFLKRKNIVVGHIWHSKKLRSKQTADIVCHYMPKAKIEERDDLNPKDPVGKFVNEIKALDKDLLIVGHLPFLSKLASALLVGVDTKEVLRLRNSGVVCLEYIDNWTVAWMITPNML